MRSLHLGNPIQHLLFLCIFIFFTFFYSRIISTHEARFLAFSICYIFSSLDSILWAQYHQSYSHFFIQILMKYLQAYFLKLRSISFNELSWRKAFPRLENVLLVIFDLWWFTKKRFFLLHIKGNLDFLKLMDVFQALA